jgi:phage tail protein X
MATQQTYVTVQGDMFPWISYQLYGTSIYSISIMRANPQYSDDVIFDAGVVLTLPAVSSQTKNISKVAWNVFSTPS